MFKRHADKAQMYSTNIFHSCIPAYFHVNKAITTTKKGEFLCFCFALTLLMDASVSVRDTRAWVGIPVTMTLVHLVKWQDTGISLEFRFVWDFALGTLGGNAVCRACTGMARTLQGHLPYWVELAYCKSLSKCAPPGPPNSNMHWEGLLTSRSQSRLLWRKWNCIVFKSLPMAAFYYAIKPLFFPGSTFRYCAEYRCLNWECVVLIMKIYMCMCNSI